MTAERFEYDKDTCCFIDNNEFKIKAKSVNEIVDLLNELNNKCEVLEIENESFEDGATRYAELYHKSLKENEQLKQSNEDARHILKREFDFATEQRQKHLDDPVVANAYDIIRFDMRKALDKLGGLE